MLIDIGYVLLKNITIPLVRSAWIKSVSGLDNIKSNQPAIIIANHASYLDFLILGSIVEGILHRPLFFWANTKVCSHPIFKYYTKCFNSVEVDVSSYKNSFWKKSIELINEGELVGIFPEGTRTRSGNMLDFNLGYLRLANSTQAQIIPIHIENTYEILPPHKSIPSFKKSMITIHKPFTLNHKLTKAEMIETNQHIFNHYFYHRKES